MSISLECDIIGKSNNRACINFRNNKRMATKHFKEKQLALLGPK